MSTALVRNEELRFVDEQGLVPIVTRWPGGRTSLGMTGLSGRLHNHVMLVPDEPDSFIDGPFRLFPFVCESSGVMHDELCEFHTDRHFEIAFDLPIGSLTQEEPS